MKLEQHCLGPILGAWLVCLCFPLVAVGADLPQWTSETMRETQAAMLIVGMGTDGRAEAAEQKAISNAISKALAFIGERASSRSRLERGEHGSRIERRFDRRSAETMLRGRTVERRVIHRLPDGRYEVFVQVRFPRRMLYEARRRAEAQWRSDRAEAAHMEERAEQLWRRGDFPGALFALQVARSLAERADNNRLEGRIAAREKALLGSIRITIEKGGGQHVPVFARPPQPIVVAVGGAGAAPGLEGVLLRARDAGREWRSLGSTNAAGQLVITRHIRPRKAGVNHIEIGLDWETLGKRPPAGVATTRVSVYGERLPRDERISVYAEPSALAGALKGALVSAGFQVIELHRTERQKAPPPERDEDLVRSLLKWVGVIEPADSVVESGGAVAHAPVDIVVKGRARVLRGTANDGWIESARAAATVEAIGSANGAVLVQIDDETPVAFGESEGLAARKAIGAVVEPVAERFVARLVDRLYTAGEEGH